MNKTYIIIDLANMFSRARHITKGDIDQKVRLAISITMTSIRKAWNDFEADHLVFCLEGRSWRKDFYKPYKANRTDKKTAMSPVAKEEDDMYWGALSEMQTFLSDKTNCTVLQHPILEADDLVSGWIDAHPKDKHIIISSDSDFLQLISNNVYQYNGVSETLTTDNGVFDHKGKPVVNKKTGNPNPPIDPEWILFEKCIRGDTSDNIFSAYPGVRKKGSKNRVGLLEAFEDKNRKGFSWNNLMLQRWIDHQGDEHRVVDDYTRNVTLIDLRAQPYDIRNIINETVEKVEPKNNMQIGVRLLKFCSSWDLETIADQVETYAKIFSSKYEKDML